MTYLLRPSLNHTANALKTQSHRLLSQGLKDTFRLQSSPPKARYCSRAYDISTNVAKDVILFKYDNPKFFKVLNFFALGQFLFWNYLSHFSYTTLIDAPVEENPDVDLKWYQRINLGENKFRNGIAISCFLIGYGVLAAAWLFTCVLYAF